MTTPLVTVEEFLGRIDQRFVQDLTSPSAGGSTDEARLLRAVTDASDELRGYFPRIAASLMPSDETKRVHATKVAMYLLTLDRPGKEYEQIRNAYTDTIKFYESLIADSNDTADGGSGSASTMGKACKPPSVFNNSTLKGFV